MKNKTPFLLLGSIVLLFLVSCGKEKSIDTSDGTNNAGSTGSEKGTWKLLNMHGITTSIVEITDGVDDVKSVTTSDYITDNNSGTLKFDGSTMTGTNIGYSMDAIAHALFYTNGVLDDSLDAPISAVIPPTNTSATYKKVAADSIYVNSGVFTTVGTNGTTQSAGGGYKLAFSGDTMTMRATADQSKVELNSGLTQRTTYHAIQILTLLKQ